MSKEETIRRLRLGDLQRFLRKRYGHSLPDDDAGREDLRELLLLASLAYNPERTMRSMIKTWVKWMAQTEAEQLMDDITRTPIYLRKPSARLLGDRLGLTDRERQELAIVTIRPHDMTDEQLGQRRKAKDAERKWRKRRAAKIKPREAWLANCKGRLKPWVKLGMSRASWYRKQAKLRQLRETSVSAVKFKGRTDLSQSVPVESQQEVEFGDN
jgi:hypothetical protein